MIIEFKDGGWHEVNESLANRWLMTGKAVKTRRVRIENGRHRDYLQYIALTGNRGWRWATGEIDEHRHTLNQLANLGRP